MAFHIIIQVAIISEQREPVFWRREPRWPIGTFDGPAKMAMAGNWQWQEAGREGHNKNSGICKENPKNPDMMGQFLTNVKNPHLGNFRQKIFP